MRQRPALPVGDFSGGIDTFATEGSKALHAVNMYHERGFLRRRPAWRSFAAAPVFYLPSARALVGVSDFPTDLPSDLIEDRIPGGISGALYVGCTEPFHGFDWGDIVASTSSFVSNRELRVQYWNGTTWVNAGFVLDTTASFPDDNSYRAPFLQNGRVHWHTLEDWDTTTIASTEAYWVRVVVYNTGTEDLSWDDLEWTMVQPGIRVFHRVSVNGLFQLGINAGLELVCCADRFPPRGLESGANVGVRFPGSSDFTELNPVLRWSAGYWSEYESPLPRISGDPLVTSTTGTTDFIVDAGVRDGVTAPEDLYIVQRPFGAHFVENIVPTGASETLLTTADEVLIRLPEHALEHFILQCTTSGGGAVASDDTHQITNFTADGVSASFAFDPPYPTPPDGSARFRVVRPPMRVALKGAAVLDESFTTKAEREYEVGVTSTSAYQIGPELNTFARNPHDVFGDGAVVNIEVREPTRFNLPAGRQYSCIAHPLGKRLLLCNGGPLLTYDGTSLSRLKVMAVDSALAEQFLDFTSYRGPDGTDPRPSAYNAQFLSEPPSGKFVATLNGFILVAGSADAPNRVQWSAGPADYSDLWPRGNEVIIRDDVGGPITGMMPYYDRILVFTAKSIHEGRPNERGFFNFRPVTNSVGFTTGHAVSKVAIGQQDVLIGPAIDGLIMYSGGEPTYLIDRWDRVIKDGIDLGDLERTSATAWQQEGYYFLAVKRRSGGNTTNDQHDINRDTILLYDYVNRRTWNWRCPFGVNRLATLSLPNGRDVLAVGTEDGFICTITEGDLDDGTLPIVGSVRTLDTTLAGGRRVNLRRVNVTANDLGGPNRTLDVNVYLDRGSRVYSVAEVPFDLGQEEAIEDVPDLVAEARDKTMPVNIPSGAKARSVSVEISGAQSWKLSNMEIEVDVLTAEKR